jgi:hypothetical protein
MDTLTKRITIGGMVVIFLLAGMFYLDAIGQQEESRMGGVNIGNEYAYTQLTGSVATTSEILDGRGMLGSVIITEDPAGTVVLYDATSTTAYSKTNGTRIADLEAAITEGVYTFDVYVQNGIIFETSDGENFAGDLTITYRQY